MVSGSVKAGVLGIVSLAVPIGVYASTDFSFYGIYWTLFSGDFGSYGTYFYNLTQYAGWDEALTGLTFLLVLVGAILLFALRRVPKAGASLMLAGLLAYIADISYGEYAYGAYYFIPIGLVLLLLGVIVGFRAKVVMPMPPAQVQASSTEQLIKLKSLLDSGAITKEEFEEQKKRILGS